MTTIREARELQKKLEIDIAGLLGTFTESTGIVIRNVFVRSHNRYSEMEKKPMVHYFIDSNAEL